MPFGRIFSCHVWSLFPLLSHDGCIMKAWLSSSISSCLRTATLGQFAKQGSSYWCLIEDLRVQKKLCILHWKVASYQSSHSMGIKQDWNMVIVGMTINTKTTKGEIGEDLEKSRLLAFQLFSLTSTIEKWPSGNAQRLEVPVATSSELNK